MESVSNEIKDIIDAHANTTREMINTLTKEVENLKINSQRYKPQTNYSHSFRNFSKRGVASPSFNRNFTRRDSPRCSICLRNNHYNYECFHNPSNARNSRGKYNSFQRNGKYNYTTQDRRWNPDSNQSRDVRRTSSTSEN